MWTACPLARDIGLCLLFVCLCVLTKYRWFDRCVFMRDVGILSAHINEHTNIHTEPATIKKKKKCCLCVATLVIRLLDSAWSINITIHAATDMPEGGRYLVLPWPTRHETFNDLMWFSGVESPCNVKVSEVHHLFLSGHINKNSYFAHFFACAVSINTHMQLMYIK